MSALAAHSPSDDLGLLLHQLKAEGYVIFPEVLSREKIDAVREALAPYLEKDLLGRNDFEGFHSERVYALIAKHAIFAELSSYPLVLDICENVLGPNFLLSACLAINLHPGETHQPFHFDDGHYRLPRPRETLGISSFWTIDGMTENNGATEIIPRSHLWADEVPEATTAEAVKVILPPGSLMITLSTLWHRGGNNRSDAPRLIITPQYCVAWCRQIENMVLAVPRETAAKLPQRVQELLGYNIHEPFMGYVDGMHPNRILK